MNFSKAVHVEASANQCNKSKTVILKEQQLNTKPVQTPKKDNIILDHQCQQWEGWKQEGECNVSYGLECQVCKNTTEIILSLLMGENKTRKRIG